MKTKPKQPAPAEAFRRKPLAGFAKGTFKVGRDFKSPDTLDAHEVKALKSLPRTADVNSVPIFPGLRLHIVVGNKRKGWRVEPTVVGAVSTECAQVFPLAGDTISFGWGDWIPEEDNRLYAKKTPALAECRRRNKPTTDGLTIIKNRYPKAWKRSGGK